MKTNWQCMFSLIGIPQCNDFFSLSHNMEIRPTEVAPSRRILLYECFKNGN